MGDICINKGIITYIYLENFVTYDKVSIKPGRNLNVIIGPNGTGKSTIVCAIVLGLGGKPSTIGRAIHVSDYVKTGYEEAKIEIHLSNGEGEDIAVCRKFDIHGKSSWYLDGEQVNIKKVQELTQDLNIQVDNLCQFLPQDKVQDFSKMNPQELLQNTERSVGDPIVLEYHKNLIQKRQDSIRLDTEIASMQKILETKNRVHESLKDSVSTIKERKLIKKKIVSLKQKKAWILYDQKRRELLKLKKKKEDAAALVESLEADAQPINDEIRTIKSEIHLLQSTVTDNNNKIQMKTAKLKKLMDNTLECENKIQEVENMCHQRIQVEKTRDNDIEMVQQQKSKLDNDLLLMLKDIGSEETLTKQRQEMLSHIESKRNIINMLTSKKSGLNQEEERLNHEIRALESELQLLNIEAKRLQLLREKSFDTYKAVLWLRENRDKFVSTVHEPILLNINVKEVSYAKYLENIIAYRDLIAFVCENKQDMNLLMHYLRDQQKLQVNVVYSDPAKCVSMEPNIPMEHIKKFGFTHYLVSLIEAPRTIMNYLISMYNLNNIPIGTNHVDDNIDRIPNGLRCYFSRNNVYAVNKSKYTGEKSVGIQVVSGTGMLSIVLDRRRLSHIKERLNSLREKKHNSSDNLKQINEQVRTVNEELDKYRASRNKYQQDLQQIQALKSRISMTEKKIMDLENGRTSIDYIKESSSNEIKAILCKQLVIYKTYNSEMEDCFKYTTTNEEIELALKFKNQSLRTKISDSQDLRDKLQIAVDKLKQINLEVHPLKTEIQKLYNEALETTDGINPSDKAFAPINKVFNKLPPTIEEINNELNIAQAKVFCMSNNIDSSNILRQYEEVEKDIDNLKDSIQRNTEELQSITQEMEKLKEQWLKPLMKTVKQINSNFGTYFSAMDCAGEVTLSQPENSMDFDQYGLKIRVKFRDTDQLQELTRYHQSGGERAVTTAIYMISLQELSTVPFRCVDEINQGMDAVNERKIFNLLVKMTGRHNSSQYFLLTPKLLLNLKYSETVTVHCVFNGPFMLGHQHFNTEQYCKHIVRIMEKENEIL